MKNKDGTIFFLVVSLIIQFMIAFFYWVLPEGREISFLCVCLNILFLFKFRFSLPILLIFAFFTLYSYAAIEFFFNGIKVSGHTGFNNEEFINKVLFINSLFITTMGNFVSQQKTKQKLVLDDFTLFKSNYIFWLLVCVGSYAIVFGITGANLLEENGGYGSGDISKSSLHEYFILIFFLILLAKPKNNRFYTFVVATLYFVYCVKTFLYGGRVEVMQITLLYLSYYYIFQKRVRKLFLLSSVTVAYYANLVVSSIRNSPIDFLKGQYAPYLNPFYKPSVRIEIPQKYLTNNQGDVLQSSARLLGLIQDGYLDAFKRINSFFTMLLSVVFPTGMMPKYTNLAAYYQVYPYRSGGGGLVSVSFFVYMGYLGPIFIGAFLAYFINLAFVSKNIGYKIYGVMLMIMFPRWYAYGPIIIFKMCFLTTVMYFVMKFTYDLFFKKNQQHLIQP